MKSALHLFPELLELVAPFAGAWIEIVSSGSGKFAEVVAPFAGAWIEICQRHNISSGLLSLPSRERGLKSGYVAMR